MADLENRVSHLETKVSVIETKVDAFIQEMRDFKTEMRDRDNQRAAEIARVEAQATAKIEALREQREKDNTKYEAEMKAMNEKIDAKFDKLSSQIQNMAIAAVVGVGAIVWAVVSAFK